MEETRVLKVREKSGLFLVGPALLVNSVGGGAEGGGAGGKEGGAFSFSTCFSRDFSFPLRSLRTPDLQSAFSFFGRARICSDFSAHRNLQDIRWIITWTRRGE